MNSTKPNLLQIQLRSPEAIRDAADILGTLYSGSTDEGFKHDVAHGLQILQWICGESGGPFERFLIQSKMMIEKSIEDGIKNPPPNEQN